MKKDIKIMTRQEGIVWGMFVGAVACVGLFAIMTISTSTVVPGASDVASNMAGTHNTRVQPVEITVIPLGENN